MRTILSLISATILLSSQVANAHISLLSPSPRTASQKQGPCGAEGGTRGPAVTYKPGETITVEWDETVDHVGHYRLAFDMDGDDLPMPVSPRDDFPSILVDQIPDRSGGGKYSQEITFPNEECDNCTLQLIQIMTVNVPYNSFYFQCVDIVLAGEPAGDSDAGVGSDPGAATGSGCSTTGRSSDQSWALLALLGMLALSLGRESPDELA